MIQNSKFLLIFVFLFIVSCDENLKLTVEDVKKLEYLNVFISNEFKKFEGHHNIDSELFEFSYEVENLNLFLHSLDENAINQNWNNKQIAKNSLLYFKKIKIFESEKKTVKVYVSFSSDNNRIYFKVK